MGENMLNLLWGSMLLIGIVYGAATGRMNEVTDAALSSAKEAVSLCITMAGIVAMWVGVMEIAKSSGLVERLTRKMQPLLSFLFPGVPREHRAMEFISANMIANDYFIIGLNKEPLTKRLYLVLFFVRETALTHQQIFYIWVISSAARLNGRTLPYSKSIAEKQSL